MLACPSLLNSITDITNHPAVEIIRKMIQPDSSSRPSMAKVLATVAELSLKPSELFLVSLLVST